MTNEYVDQRLKELGIERRKADAQPRAMQLRRRKRALAGAPIPVTECEMCGKNPREARRGNQSLCLDHDHATGAFRGWLCHGCNLGLGLLGDNEESLVRALEYLRRKAVKPAVPGKRLAGMLAVVGLVDWTKTGE